MYEFVYIYILNCEYEDEYYNNLPSRGGLKDGREGWQPMIQFF